MKKAKVEKLTQQVAAKSEWSCELGAFEREVEAEKKKVGAAAVEKFLAKHLPERNTPKGCPLCGRVAGIKELAVERTFESLNGRHTFRRNRHYCKRCQFNFYPLDEKLGLSRDSDLSPELEKRALDFAVNDTYEASASRFELHHGCKLSANQFRQVAKRLGTDLEQSQPLIAHAQMKAVPAEGADVLYVLNDGGMLPMVKGEWKEAKVGVLFDQASHVRGTEEQRGIITDTRYIAVLGNVEEFKREMRWALYAENYKKARSVVWLADGSPANWNLARSLVPRAIQVLDWCHAVENAVKVAKAVYGEYGAELPAWKKTMESFLWEGDGDVDGMVKHALTHLDPAGLSADQLKAVSLFIGYFRENAARVKYRTFKEQGLLIGSGPVESAHRHVLHARMKKAGQHWSHHHGRRMARLRAAYKTAGTAHFYERIRKAHWETRAYRGRKASSARN